MSEPLLKAILRLFVIVAKEDDITESERQKVIEFLELHLNHKNAEKYVAYFDEIGKEAIQNSHDKTAISEMQDLLSYCKQINIELTKKQKTVLIKELIELILADGIITKKEKDLVNAIADAIYVDNKDIDNFKIFITASSPEDLIGSAFLIIGDRENKNVNNQKVQFREDLKGSLCFMYSDNSDTYFVKYIGRGELQLNNIMMVAGKIQVFSTGSAIRSQNTEPVFYSDVVSGFNKNELENAVAFDANNIHFRFPNGNYGLQDINLHETSGSLIGLMGASGAGKSTLLHVLNGSEKPTKGEVLINGINIHSQKDKIEGVIGFVPQDDLLIEDLTVFQNLFYAGRLCFGDLSDTDLTELVNKTLQSLGLYETRDLKVGSPLDKTISGGQRKRVNIGLELLREPGVLFVDEPTSGLSSRDSENIMDLLKELSLRSKLVFVVIHQPSSEIFKMFDKLLILDVGGYQIYYGNPVEAVVYFKDIIDLVNKDESQCEKCGNINPEQIFNIIETRVVDEYGRITKSRKILPEQWHENYEQRRKPFKIEVNKNVPPSSLKIPGFIKQMKVFITRDFLSKISNRQYMIINFLEAPLLALLLALIVRYYSADESNTAGYLFSKNVNIPSYIFMSIIVALFMGLTVSAEEIFKDRKILKREQFLNLSRGSYLFSKVLLLLILSAIQTFLFVLIGNTILEINGMYFYYWAIFFSCAFFANMLGLNISSAFNSAVTIYILIPILLIPQLLLSGVVVKFDKLNPSLSNEAKVPVVGDLMASRWAMEAAMVVQFKNNNYEKMFFEKEKKIYDAEYKKLYFLPNLNTKLDYCSNNFRSNDDKVKNKINYNLSTLYNELSKELRIVGRDKFPDIDKLNPENFNSSVYSSTRKFLSDLNTFYISKYNKGIREKEKIIINLTDTPEKAEAFKNLRARNENETIASLVKNEAEPNRIVEIGGKLIRKLNPVYMRPVDYKHMLDFRTQFYTSEKYFMGQYFSTFWFNVSIMWTMSIILYILLYFDVLRKIVNIKLNR